MLYSSGTTGRPKGVFVPPESTDIAFVNSLLKVCMGPWGMGPDTVYLSPGPLYHAAPLRFAMSVMRLGGTVVVMEHFDPERYLALVRGRPEPSEGLVDYAIPRGEEGERVPAQTEYRVVHQLAHYALVEARPLTGRLHQIRRHFKHLRHPIVYDMQYGRGRFNARCHEDCGIARMALHAASLSFPHPRTGQRVHVTAPLPEDLAAPFRRLAIPPAFLPLDN